MIMIREASMANSTTFLALLFIFSSVFFFPQPTTCSGNKTDLLSLLAFKSAIDLDPLGALSSWSETTTDHFCNWTGVGCSRRHPDRVIEINLMSQGLVGSLSPHIGNLSFLRIIILQNNTFHGPIPEQISLLRRLEFVELSNNSFSGSLPRNLSRCPNLAYLNFIDNNLSGIIPPELGSISTLGSLGLSLNKLSGSIPESIGNITSLIRLSLGQCSLTGNIPESLAYLPSLDFLQIGYNNLTGRIPSALFNMSTVRSFMVGQNLLHGVIPSNIGVTLPNLRRLYLFQNQFSGPIPVSISNNASFLTYIDFLQNQFTGPIPRAGRLTRLQEFVFESNLIEDDISFISSLTNSTNLEDLSVADNLFTGSLPESIANLSTNLRNLFLSMNKINGNIPSGIGNLISLESIGLETNNLNGPIPPEMAKLSNLMYLYLESNRFSSELKLSFGNFSFLSRLFLSHNNLSGIVPPSLGNCTNLLELHLSHNSFSGFIPRDIMRQLSPISIAFDLSSNALEGSIPDEVGSLTNLVELDLSNNKLSGLVPNSLSKCISLEKLYVQGNLLEGEIPMGLKTLVVLQDLDLSANHFSGVIPSFMGKLNLKKLNLSFNMLHGQVPTAGVFKNRSSIFLDGNEGLCGGIWDLKLPPCPAVESSKKNLSTLLMKILIPTVVAGGLCLVILVFFNYKQRTPPQSQTSSMLSSSNVMRLSYGDILKATGGFSESNLVGAGRFGSVYKGTLDDGKTFVAIKVLNLLVRGASKSLAAECNALRGIRHRNLVRILSVCESIDFQGNDFKAIVYEFKANGSLEKWLYHSRDQEEERRQLSIAERLSIAIDIAQAVEYLHFGTDSPIVHGDLKPSNILLDREMTACVGDFGLAKIVSNTASSHGSSSSIGIRGTLGYIPPEYGTNRSVSTQGDAYSFGIVLLEMFTNKRPTDDLFEGDENLRSFVGAALLDNVVELWDPLSQTGQQMKNGKIKDCMTCVLNVGVSCSKEIPSDRMSMVDVVNELHKIQKLLLAERTVFCKDV
ncbi:hypothetical protein C2S53_013480 [Perilla frutescens var. hirtella]|uniref:non-specific serine/threonine protein kinase n=1 Tax=Perilla frutescens var. hirtella TaxID=608512 RepID=A0AAD4J814_PERFH|nr:hypothetical protein C2S53_013480 [Perilla frutescens var. hirtella]